MDIAAKHIAFVIAAYGISGAVLIALLVRVLLRRKSLHKIASQDASDVP